MPGFIHNYELSSVTGNHTEKFDTLACKLVTSFHRNSQLNPPKPNILANIFVLNPETGELKAIVAGTEITAWRTAAASIVSTDHLYLNHAGDESKVLAIVGCGVQVCWKFTDNLSLIAELISYTNRFSQGRIHAIGLATLKSLSKIYLWNRTESRARQLGDELNSMRQQFRNLNLEILCVSSVAECVQHADIVVTATFTSSPLVSLSMLKERVHINGW